MFRVSRLCIAVTLCASICAPVLSIQGPEPQPWPDVFQEPLYLYVIGESKLSNYSLADYSVARVQSDAISTELATDTSEWTGDYGQGMDLAYLHFRWAPRSGFVRVTIDTCRPSLRNLNHGSATEHPLFIEVSPLLGRDGSPMQASVRLFKVKWGEERYLVREDDLGSFCDHVAGLGEFNGESPYEPKREFLRKLVETPDPAFELPILPPGYEHLVKKSIDVEIVEIGRPHREKSDSLLDEAWEHSVTPVTINAGRSAGVTPGMVFRLFESDNAEVITVTKVGESASVGEIIRTVRTQGVPLVEGDDGHDRYSAIFVGWRASTSMHKVLASYSKVDE